MFLEQPFEPVDVDSCKVPPQFLIGNMEHFVLSSCLPELKRTIGLFRTDCTKLVQAVAKKKGAARFAAKEKLERLSQKLVATLIHKIESENMLKAAVLSQSSAAVAPTLH